MKSKKILSEIARMKSLFGYERGVVISEQTMMGTVPSVYPQTPPPPQSEEQKIAQEIVDATQGAGTNPKNVMLALNKIKNADQFWNVNSGLKMVGNKMDFQTIINDEYGVLNGPDATNIINKLKEWGIDATAQIDGRKMVSNTFKITSLGNITKKPDDNKKKPQQTTFTANENFPLKFQQSGEKIKQLQTALDVRNKSGQPNITGKFWTATEAAVKAKAGELGMPYSRATGVDEALFNAIIDSSNKGVATTKPKEDLGTIERTKLGDVTATAPSSPTIAARPTSLPTSQANVGPNPNP